MLDCHLPVFCIHSRLTGEGDCSCAGYFPNAKLVEHFQNGYHLPWVAHHFHNQGVIGNIYNPCPKNLRNFNYFRAIASRSIHFDYSDRLAVLREGQLYAIGRPEEVLTKEVIAATFGLEVEILRIRDTIFVHALRSCTPKSARS